MKPRTCSVTECPLYGGRPVWGMGSDSPLVMLIGEAPGADEESYGRPFVGKSGQELTMYLTKFTRISRERCWITNLIKCRPPNNRDPHVDEVRMCHEEHLYYELLEVRPNIIGVVGRAATQFFLGGVTMEKVHGIPQSYFDDELGKMILVPLYHPAYGLHSPRQMKDVIEDFTVLGRVIRNQVKPRQQEEVEVDYALEEGYGL